VIAETEEDMQDASTVLDFYAAQAEGLDAQQHKRIDVGNEDFQVEVRHYCGLVGTGKPIYPCVAQHICLTILKIFKVWMQAQLRQHVWAEYKQVNEPPIHIQTRASYYYLCSGAQGGLRSCGVPDALELPSAYSPGQ